MSEKIVLSYCKYCIGIEKKEQYDKGYGNQPHLKRKSQCVILSRNFFLKFSAINEDFYETKRKINKKRYYQLNLREYFEPVYRKHKTIMQIMKGKINARSNHLWPDSLFTEFI